MVALLAVSGCASAVAVVDAERLGDRARAASAGPDLEPRFYRRLASPAWCSEDARPLGEKPILLFVAVRATERIAKELAGGPNAQARGDLGFPAFDLDELSGREHPGRDLFLVVPDPALLAAVTLPEGHRFVSSGGVGRAAAYAFETKSFVYVLEIAVRGWVRSPGGEALKLELLLRGLDGEHRSGASRFGWRSWFCIEPGRAGPRDRYDVYKVLVSEF